MSSPSRMKKRRARLARAERLRRRRSELDLTVLRRLAECKAEAQRRETMRRNRWYRRLLRRLTWGYFG